MSTYTVTLRADQAALPMLLANGNPVGQGEAADGRHWARWADPFKKPCYLFAVVAGKLDVLRDTYTTASGRRCNSPSMSSRASSISAHMRWRR